MADKKENKETREAEERREGEDRTNDERVQTEESARRPSQTNTKSDPDLDQPKEGDDEPDRKGDQR